MKEILKENFKLLDDFLSLHMKLSFQCGVLHIMGKQTRDMIINIIDKNHITVNDYIELTPGRFPNPSIKVRIDLKNEIAEAVSFEKAVPVGLSDVRLCKINADKSKDSKFINEYLRDWLTDFKENDASLYEPRKNRFYFKN